MIAVDMERVTAQLVEAVPQERWGKLASRRIFFAHKSVGYNIIEGVNALVAENPRIGLRIVEPRSPADLDLPGFGHVENGINGDPLGKIGTFQKALDGGFGARVDVAFLKFCWADFTGETDFARLFHEYQAAMRSLKAAHPSITFVHFTVPLTVKQSGPKALLKKALGRPIFGLHENVARNRFNTLIRREYEGKEPVFDVATWESTMPDGTRKEFAANGQIYYELLGEYASDSGHLNAGGQRWVAAHLLALLASLPHRAS